MTIPLRAQPVMPQIQNITYFMRNETDTNQTPANLHLIRIQNGVLQFIEPVDPKYVINENAIFFDNGDFYFGQLQNNTLTGYGIYYFANGGFIIG